MQAFAKDPTNKEAQAVLSAIPTQVGLTRTTCVATMLKAGHAENALPQSATATINCRIFPGETAEEVQATLMQVSGNTSLEIRLLADAPGTGQRLRIVSISGRYKPITGLLVRQSQASPSVALPLFDFVRIGVEPQ